MKKYRIPYNMYVIIIFILRYIQNDIKDKYLYSFHNKISRHSSLHYKALLSYFTEFSGNLWDSLLL